MLSKYQLQSDQLETASNSSNEMQSKLPFIIEQSDHEFT